MSTSSPTAVSLPPQVHPFDFEAPAREALADACRWFERYHSESLVHLLASERAPLASVTAALRLNAEAALSSAEVCVLAAACLAYVQADDRARRDSSDLGANPDARTAMLVRFLLDGLSSAALARESR